MYGRIKVGRCSLKFLWLIFLMIQILLIVLIVSGLSSPNWVKSDFEKNAIYKEQEGYYLSTYYTGSFDGSKFEGSISQCKFGCSKSYSVESTEWCNIYDDLDNAGYTDMQYYYDVKSLCLMFIALAAGGGAFVIFELISLVAIVVWSVAMFFFLRRVNCMWMTHCCSICSCISHYLAILLWFGITGATYGECTVFPDDGSKPDLCAIGSPSISVVVMILFPFASVIYVIVACIAYPKRNLPEFQLNTVIQFAPAPVIIQPPVSYMPVYNPHQPNPPYAMPYASNPAYQNVFNPMGSPYGAPPNNLSGVPYYSNPPVSG